MPELTHIGVDCSAETVCEHLERDGAVVIDGVLDEAGVDAVLRELSPFFETARSGRNEFAGFHTQRIGALMARSPACRRACRRRAASSRQRSRRNSTSLCTAGISYLTPLGPHSIGCALLARTWRQKRLLVGQG